MTPDQIIDWAFQVSMVLLAIGAWWGRQDAAQRAATAALSHAESRLETKVAELDRRIEEANSNRTRDFDRLHNKSSETQRMIAENHAEQMRVFVHRHEFDRLDRDLHSLTARVNSHLDSRTEARQR